MKTTNLKTLIAAGLLAVFMLSTSAAEAQNGPDLFQLVLKSDHKGIAEAISNGQDVNSITSVGYTPLMSAAKIGDYRVIKTLLDNQADVNMCNQAGGTALMIAAKYGHAHIISELLSSGADPTIKTNRGYTAATFALGYKHREAFNLLKKAETKFITLR